MGGLLYQLGHVCYNTYMEYTKQPLAFALRPVKLSEIVGQQHLIGENKILDKCLKKGVLFSMIFYGPPGTGKTTLAMVLANTLNQPYRLFNAVTGNKKDLEIIFEEAKYLTGLIVIIDEVHRLNKDKQDLLLPHIENGSIIMIGATTANPIHAINPAIRSRCHLFEVKALESNDILKALQHALISERGLNNEFKADNDALQLIVQHCNGDIRYALNVLEIVALSCESHHINKESILQYSQIPNMSMDHDGDGYYDVLSAFQKSIRGSDVDAALYYLGILISANDFESIERRLLVTAYEDIGLANPNACARCVQAIDAAKRVGFPEGRIPLAHAVIDLSLSPKSKSGEAGIDAALQAIHTSSYQVPDYLRLTPVALAKAEQYDYERSDLWPFIQYLPDKLSDATFYIPSNTSSYEEVLAKNLEKLKKHKRSNQLAKLKKQTF